ncbi:zonadhesin-like [Cydia amplana]|uniref:zonadhesin-like n=1 Tax=Cydia amplana TaxID=1869771 RepID=UPI002FE66F1D
MCVSLKLSHHPPKCPKNEVYYNCTGDCIPRKCSELGFELHCNKKCKRGCVCKDNYVRNDHGVCIPIEKCPSCGGDENAQRGCGNHCGRSCSDIGKPPRPCPLFCIYNGCDCRPGYYYDPNTKKCVKPKDCTPTCPANEEYNTCINGGCDARNCSQLGKPVPCIKIDPKYCIKGCVCVKGYLRTKNGTCVPEKQCNSCDGDPNAVKGCGYHCGNTCTTYKGKHPICPRIPCKPNGCECKKGFVFDTNLKKCVLPEDCTKCGPNEVYDKCPAPCPPKQCNINEALIRCRAPPKPGDPECKPGCRCADNYYRNATGSCVLKKRCEKPFPCPHNEHYDPCPMTCPPQECGVNPAVILCLPNPVYGDPRCKPSCVCKDGELRNDARQCVPKDKCPPKCSKNEHYEQCYYSCGGNQTCDDIGKKWNCPAKLKCQSGCRCDEGYWRDKYGRCIPKKQCPKQCGKNEHWDTCYLNCGVGQSCDDIGKNWTCPKRPQCQIGCRCDVGYWRNKKGICIPEKECPIKRCGKNEYWEPCIQDCRNQSCNLLGKPPGSCPGRIVGQCNSGCRCLAKYYRDWTGTCIPESECPRCEQRNEDWVHCIRDCSKQTCEELITGKVNQCPEKPGGICPGGSGCRCRQGAYRNGSNICVIKEQCPTGKCPPGEVWNWCPAIKCDADYCAKNKDSPTRCPIGIVCDPPRCVCAINKKRDRKTGKCIPIADCPPFPCPPNEEYKVCPLPCPGETCSDYITGPRRGDCPPNKRILICIPQCRCCKGYSRNVKGTCIPSKNCPNASVTTTAPPTTTTRTSASDRGSGLSGVLDGITAFTGKSLYDRIQSSPNENIIMSAMSVFTPIAQLCMYTNGPAFDQCIKILNLKDKQDIRDTFANFSSLYEGVTSVNFTTAAKVYANDKYPLSDDFIKDVIAVFRAAAQNLDFSKNAEAAAIMNSWVASQTNNRIKDIVAPDMISPLTRLVLVNAIYFKGDWKYKFNENNTKVEDFYLSDGSTGKVKLMFQEFKDLEYGEVPSLDCKVVRILYTGKESSAIIILPNSINGTIHLAKDLQDTANWKKVLDSLSPQKVELYLPKFVISTTTDLMELLQKAGITHWFDCRNSGLSGILAKPEDICISAARQKAWCEFSEVGTEAAAANVIGVGTTSVGPPPPSTKIFRADHEFLYYVLVKDIVTFEGRLAKPSTE